MKANKICYIYFSLRRFSKSFLAFVKIYLCARLKKELKYFLILNLQNIINVVKDFCLSGVRNMRSSGERNDQN